MTILPEIREQLLDAAAESYGWRRRVPTVGLAITASTLVCLAVAAGFLFSLHHGTVGRSGGTSAHGEPSRTWGQAYMNAIQETRRQDPACYPSPAARASRQRILDTAPGRDITATLSSLAHQSNGPHRVTAKLLRALYVNADRIYARYAWRGRMAGVTFYAVPAAVVGTVGNTASVGRTAERLRARCRREEIATARAATRHLPPRQRMLVLAMARKHFARRPLGSPGVCLITMVDRDKGQSCLTTAQLTSHDRDAGSVGNDTSTTTALVVPDEVASVTASYPAENQVGRVPHAFAVTKRPIHNVVIFHLTGGWDPPVLAFRSRSGAVWWSSRRR